MTHVNAFVVKDRDWYVARCLQYEVASQGRNVEEALEHLTEALQLYFEDMQPSPETAQAFMTSIDVPLPMSA